MRSPIDRFKELFFTPEEQPKKVPLILRHVGVRGRRMPTVWLGFERSREMPPILGRGHGTKGKRVQYSARLAYLTRHRIRDWVVVAVYANALTPNGLTSRLKKKYPEFDFVVRRSKIWAHHKEGATP